MLRWRLAGAALIIFPTLALLWLDDQHNFARPGIWLLPLGLVLGWNAARELASLVCDDTSVKFDAPIYTTICILIFSAPVFQLWDVATCSLGFWGWTPLALASTTGLVVLVEMRRFGRKSEGGGEGNAAGGSAAAAERVAPRMVANLFVVSFVGIPLAFTLALRQLSLDRAGLLIMVSVIFVVKCSDAGAYFAGRFLGRTKLAPVLSPKKTWEGLVGGAIVAILAAVLFHRVIAPSLAETPHQRSLIWLALYALTLTLAGLLGDLSISLLKRDADRKDSGQMLPGLGGCLDVIDSMLWACPLGYLWWIS